MNVSVDKHVEVTKTIAILHNLAIYHGDVDISTWRATLEDDLTETEAMYLNDSQELRALNNELGGQIRVSESDIRIRGQATREILKDRIYNS